MNVIVKSGEGLLTCTLDEFLEANRDLEPEEIADIRAAITNGLSARGGGGAAPIWEIHRRDRWPSDVYPGSTILLGDGDT